MKRIFFLLLAAALAGGCARHYRVTFTDGTYETALGKPKFDPKRGSFIYIRADGTTNVASQAGIRSVAPESWRSSDDPKSFHYNQ